MEKEIITGVAIYFNGKIFGLRKPARHIDVFRHFEGMCVEGIIRHPLANGVQGFVTNLGRFVDRKEGLEVARKANQIKFPEHVHGGMLFSEVLW